jgi:hypothetical protein
VVMKSTNFWDITPCSPSSVNRRFGGTCRRHLQGQENKFRNKPTCKQVESRRPWRWRRYVPPRLRLTLNGLHGVISQKLVFFMEQYVYDNVIISVQFILRISRAMNDWFKLPSTARYKRHVSRRHHVCRKLISSGT